MEADNHPVSRREFEDLRRELDRQQSVEAIRRLHYAYGYYMDRLLFDEVVALFEDDCSIHFQGGVYLGKAGARRLYGGRLGQFAQRKGLLVDHLMLQGVIDIAPDGNTADARFRCLVQGGVHETVAAAEGRRNQYWHSGLYENSYSRASGTWRIQTFRYTTVWEADYDLGWGKADPTGNRAKPADTCFPEDPCGPDRLEAMPALFPDNETVPFHYPNPVTGQRWSATAPES